MDKKEKDAQLKAAADVASAAGAAGLCGGGPRPSGRLLVRTDALPRALALGHGRGFPLPGGSSQTVQRPPHFPATSPAQASSSDAQSTSSQTRSSESLSTQLDPRRASSESRGARSARDGCGCRPVPLLRTTPAAAFVSRARIVRVFYFDDILKNYYYEL